MLKVVIVLRAIITKKLQKMVSHLLKITEKKDYAYRYKGRIKTNSQQDAEKSQCYIGRLHRYKLLWWTATHTGIICEEVAA